MVKRFSRYILKLFILYGLSLLSLLGGVAWLFEVLTQGWKSGKTSINLFYSALLKVPFIVHKGLPFVVFGATCLLFWRLIRFREDVALQSAGCSLWQMVRPIISVVGILCLGDILFLDPLSQRLLTETPSISSIPTAQKMSSLRGWQKLCVPTGTILVQSALENFETNWYFFSKEGKFLQQVNAQNTHMVGDTLYLKQVWVLRPAQTPQWVEQMIWKKPQDLSFQDAYVHPALMSFWTIQSLLFVEEVDSPMLYLRWIYLLTSALSVLFLVPFAASISMGYGGRSHRQKSVWIMGGSIVCLGAYLLQEGMYFWGMSAAYGFPPKILWIVPLGILGVATFLWMEKNQV